MTTEKSEWYVLSWGSKAHKMDDTGRSICGLVGSNPAFWTRWQSNDIWNRKQCKRCLAVIRKREGKN